MLSRTAIIDSGTDTGLFSDTSSDDVDDFIDGARNAYKDFNNPDLKTKKKIHLCIFFLLIFN